MSPARVPVHAAGWASGFTRVPWGGRTLRLHHVSTTGDWAATGRGPGPLLLLHGMASSWRQWRSLMVRLAPVLPIVALDLPGFGESERARAPLAAGDYALMLEAWCRARGVGRVRLVGHSFGGAVAVDWAGRWPQRCERLGLLAPAAVYHDWYTAGEGPIRWPLVGPLLLGPVIWLASTKRFGPRVFGHIVTRLEDIADDELADLQWGCRHASEMRRALDYYRFPDLDARLAAITAPTLIGWGTADRVVPYADAARYLGGLRQAALREWPGCGHLPMFERREACAAWLQEVGA